MVTFDGGNKLIICNAGTTELNIKRLYSAWKEWVVISDNSKYPVAFNVVGGESAVGNNIITPYFFLKNGWKIRPQEANHTLQVEGILIADGDPFTDTLGVFRVGIQSIVPIYTESVIFETGSGVTAQDKIDIANQVNDVLADDFASISIGNVSVDLTGIATTSDITNQTADLKGVDNRDLSQVYSNTPDVNLAPVMTAIDALHDFDPNFETVVASNMRGTDGANTVEPDNASIAAILVDTNELQTNQGDWATATGFATTEPDNANIAAIKAKVDTLENTDLAGIATSQDIAGIPAPTTPPTANEIAAAVESILADDFANVSLSPETANLIAAIKAKTDQLLFTKANELDVNQKSINGATVYGNGTDADKWRGTP